MEKATLGSYKGGLYTEVAFLLSDHFRFHCIMLIRFKTNMVLT